MPYKDPEKAKAAKKAWDEKNRKGRSGRIWWAYLYLDSAPEDWKDRLREAGMEILAVVHDSDVDESGEIKKTHVHVLVRFSHAVRRTEAVEVLTSFGCLEKSVQRRDSWTACARYLCHMDDPSKFQYDPACVMEFGGADYMAAISRTSDKYRVVGEMQDWVCEFMKDGTRPRSFAELNDYARANNLEWFMALCDNSATIMREFCKSKRYDWLEKFTE